MAEASHWFERYRGLAVTIVAAGNYIAGTFWPPLVNWGTQTYGWRATHFGIAIACGVLMTILVLVLRQIMGGAAAHDHSNAPPPRVDLNLSTNTLTCCSASPASPAAWRWRCRRSISSPIAAISVTARRAARKCCR
jgi:MFS family permease